MTNSYNRALQNGGHAFGTLLGISRDPVVVQWVAEAGFDWVTIDMEHSSFSWETVSSMFAMARACGITPVCRLAEATKDFVGKALDLGAQGLEFHDVESPEQVARIVSWTKGSKWAGRTGDVDSFRDDFTLTIQIESKAGLEAIDEILSVDRVDVVEVGRGDLSLSLGHPLERDHPVVLAALDEIVAGCNRHGVAPGAGVVHRPNLEGVQDLVGRGFRSLLFSHDKGMIRNGLAAGMGYLREATGKVNVGSAAG